MHDNEKKYKYNTCDKPFTRKDYLDSHLKTYQINKQFHTCDNCGRSYKLKHNLQKHMKDNHQYSIPGQGFATTSQCIPNKNNVKCKV